MPSRTDSAHTNTAPAFRRQPLSNAIASGLLGLVLLTSPNLQAEEQSASSYNIMASPLSSALNPLPSATFLLILQCRFYSTVRVPSSGN